MPDRQFARHVRHRRHASGRCCFGSSGGRFHALAGVVGLGGGVDDRLRRVGAFFQHRVDRIAERSPVVVQLRQLRARIARRRRCCKPLHQGVAHLHALVRRHVACHIYINLLRFRADHVDCQRYRTRRVLSVLVDVEPVHARQRRRRAARPCRHRRDRQVVLQVGAVVAQRPRPVDDHVRRPFPERRIRCSAVCVELYVAFFLQRLQVRHRFREAALVACERALGVEQLAAERAPEPKVVVGILVQRQRVAALYQLEQLLRGLRRRGNLGLVVVQRHRLQRLRHTIQLAVHGAAFNRQRQRVVQHALGQLGHVQQQPGPHLGAQVIVGRDPHIRPAASGSLGLELGEHLIKRDLQHVDRGLGELGLRVLDDFPHRRFFRRAGAVGMPDRQFARHVHHRTRAGGRCGSGGFWSGGCGGSGGLRRGGCGGNRGSGGLRRGGRGGNRGSGGGNGSRTAACGEDARQHDEQHHRSKALHSRSTPWVSLIR